MSFIWCSLTSAMSAYTKTRYHFPLPKSGVSKILETTLFYMWSMISHTAAHAHCVVGVERLWLCCNLSVLSWCLSYCTKTMSRFFWKTKSSICNGFEEFDCLRKAQINFKFSFVIDIFIYLCSTRALSNLYIFNFTKRSTPWLTHWITYIFFWNNVCNGDWLCFLLWLAHFYPIGYL